MEYSELFKELDSKKIRYLICGGMAVNIYGIPRMTADIDLLLDFEERNISDFEKMMEELNYQPQIPFSLKNLIDKSKRIEVIKERNLIAFSFFNSVSNTMNVDVLIDVPMTFEELWNNRELRNVEDYKVHLVSINDLIELKKYSNRIQDQKDILLLSKIKNL